MSLRYGVPAFLALVGMNHGITIHSDKLAVASMSTLLLLALLGLVRGEEKRL